MAEHDTTAMLAAGKWRATAEGQDPHTIGFHISALYSPVGWLSWEQIARDWEAARAALWLLGADRYGDRFWQQLRDQITDAPMMPAAPPPTAAASQPPVASDTQRPRGWLAPRTGWLR